MKREAIKKVFGAKPRAKCTPLTGGIGAAVAIIDGLTKYNWETAWPSIQKATIGLGGIAIAIIQGAAIRKGLFDLADRIASFRPVASPMPGEALTRAEAMPVPYVPFPTIKAKDFDWTPETDWFKELGYEKESEIKAPPGRPDLVWVVLNEGLGIMVGQGLMFDDLGVEDFRDLTEEKALGRGTLMDRTACPAEHGAPEIVHPGGPFGYPIYMYL